MSGIDIGGLAVPSAADVNTRIGAEDSDAWRYLTLAAIFSRMPGALIVAASDSTLKQFAHYQCDGTADEVQIQQAIDALPDMGGEVLLLAGSYKLSDSIVIERDNVTLRGQGNSGVQLSGNGTLLYPAQTFPAGQYLLQVQKPGALRVRACTLRDFTIGRNAQPLDNTINGLQFCVYRSYIDNIGIFKMNGDGMYFHGDSTDISYECRFTNCEFSGCNQGVVLGQWSTDSHFVNCVFLNNVHRNLYGSSGGHMFANCHFYAGIENQPGTWTQINIELYTSVLTRFTGCKFEMAGREIIWLNGDPTGGDVFFGNCGWYNGSRDTTNTYSQLKVTGAQWNIGIDDACQFKADTTLAFGPKYNIEFDASLLNSRIGLCRMRNALTAPHTTLTNTIGIRTTIGGLGFNSTNPNTAATNWYQQGQHGALVRASDTGAIWLCTAPPSTWTQIA